MAFARLSAKAQDLLLVQLLNRRIQRIRQREDMEQGYLRATYLEEHLRGRIRVEINEQDKQIANPSRVRDSNEDDQGYPTDDPPSYGAPSHLALRDVLPPTEPW